MALMTWAQLSKHASDTMIHMQNVIDSLRHELEVTSERAGRYAHMVKSAQDERRDIEMKLDDHRFVDNNLLGELETLREWRDTAPGKFAVRVAERAEQADHTESLDTLRRNVVYLNEALKRKSPVAVCECASHIGATMMKLIQKYGP
jgi:polyhydroxyalkanoate synthesis regulator phasin